MHGTSTRGSAPPCPPPIRAALSRHQHDPYPTSLLLPAPSGTTLSECSVGRLPLRRARGSPNRIRRVRLALLSTARINELLVAGARRARDVEVVAIGSRDRDRAEAQAAKLRIDRAYDSYEALIAAPDVDAVYVALPNSMHVEWSIRALEAGKHVLCEKPLSRRPDDVERAFDAADRA